MVLNRAPLAQNRKLFVVRHRLPLSEVLRLVLSDILEQVRKCSTIHRAALDGNFAEISR
jgi:hypothetical protein